MTEITETEHEYENLNDEKRIKSNEDSLRDLWDNIKCTNIRIIGVPEEDRKKGPKKIFEEIITENFPNMRKETVTQFRKQRETHTR